jgi:hypothetical protein
MYAIKSGKMAKILPACQFRTKACAIAKISRWKRAFWLMRPISGAIKHNGAAMGRQKPGNHA